MGWLKKLSAPAPKNDLLSLAKGVIKKPEDRACVEAFSSALPGQTHFQWQPSLEIALILTLESRFFTPVPLADPWYRILSANPQFSPVFTLSSCERYEDFKNRLSGANAETLLLNPLFCTGLKFFVLTNLGLERFLTHIRRFLLDCRARDKNVRKNFLPLASALALYCFNTGYIFNVTDEEAEQIKKLKESLTSPRRTDEEAFDVALLGCYEALYTHPGAPEFVSAYEKHPLLASLISESVSEPLKEREIADSIPRLTPIEGETSIAVREQYIEFPYPRWRALGEAALSGELARFKDQAADILIAGCGTGHEALSLARAFPDAKILAIDLSPASLAYAIRKTEEYGLKNIEYAQADILALPGATDRRFDLIASGGVLHHLKNPEQGFDALHSLLKPGGFMRLGLYSEQGRRNIAAAQAIIAARRYGNTAEEIRRFRHDAPGILPLEVLTGITRARDFFIMSQCRDLLFHVMEHRFDIPRIAAMLDKHGYEFSGFILDNKTLERFRAAFPDDPNAVSLPCWEKFESDNPDTFMAMYKFVCRKPA